MSSTGSGSRGSSGGSGSGSAAATAASSASSSSAAAAAMAAAAFSAQLVAAKCSDSGLHQHLSVSGAAHGGSRAFQLCASEVRRRPISADVGSSSPKVCSSTVRARTMPALHCACVLTAVHRVLVQSSPSRPRTSRRAHRTALVLLRSSLRARPCALIARRASAV